MVCAIVQWCDALKSDDSWGIAEVRWCEQDLLEYRTISPHATVEEMFSIITKNWPSFKPILITTFYLIYLLTL